MALESDAIFIACTSEYKRKQNGPVEHWLGLAYATIVMTSLVYKETSDVTLLMIALSAVCRATHNF